MSIEYGYVVRSLREWGHAILITYLNGETPGSKLLMAPSEELYPGEEGLSAAAGAQEPIPASVVEEYGKRFLREVLYDLPRLVVLGAGHVGMCVASLAKDLGFYVIVADDRPDFLTAERFPSADERLLCGSFEDSLLWQQIPKGENVFFVLASRSHMTDAICMSHVLLTRARYIGMLGSHKKCAHVKDQMLEKKFTEEDISRIHSPIGLPLGGQTPMEVAFSIMAEIVKERHTVEYPTVDPDVANELLSPTVQKAVMVTITEKIGSSPRGVGERMLVLPDGTLIGSVGGGGTEYAVMQEALSMMDGGTPAEKTFMHGEDGGGCGKGGISVLLEPLELGDEAEAATERGEAGR